MNKKYYIAYGSNLNLPQMRMRCKNARIIGTSVIDDYQLLFKGDKVSSYLTIEAKKGGKVPVAVWEVTPNDEQALDDYEDYPSLYYKKTMILNIKGMGTEKIRRIEAFVYIMHEERKLGIPSSDYVRICLNGYRAFGFDEKYLWDALEISRRNSQVK